MHVETTSRCPFTPSRLEKVKKLDKAIVVEAVKQLQLVVA